MTMRTNNFKAILKAGLRVVCILPFAAAAAFGQQVVNLTAAPTSITLPDGTAVPMWGYFCGTAAAGATATCGPLNPASVSTVAGVPSTRSPVVITVPTGQGLTISLTNSLSFAGGSIPTSLVIVGQLGGGLGTPGGFTAAPDHTNAQPLTWPIAGDAPGAPVTGVGTPPAMGQVSGWA